MKVAVRLVVMLAAIRGCTPTEERLHFRIVVPEFINTLTHTKTVYVMPKKGKSLEDAGLVSALGAAGGGTGIGGPYGGATGTGYGTAAGYNAAGPTPSTAPGFGVTGGSGGYGFASSGQSLAGPSALGGTGGALTSYGGNAVQNIPVPGPSPTRSSPVIIPISAPPLPPPPPPGTIIVAAGHDASFAELLSHSNRVRQALRAQRLLRGFNRGTASGTTAPAHGMTQAIQSPRLQSQSGTPTIPPELQAVYGYYGLNTGQRYQPVTVYSQSSKRPKCTGGNLVGSSALVSLQDGRGNKHGQQIHAVYTSPGSSYIGNGGSYGVYAGFTTPQSVPVNSGHSLYNAYNALPVPPAYSAALHGNQNVRPTLSPASGQLSTAGYTTTQIYPTAQYQSGDGYQGNYVYNSQYRQPQQFTSYGNKVQNPYSSQQFTFKDGLPSLQGGFRPQQYNVPSHAYHQLPQGSVLSKPPDYSSQKDVKYKDKKLSPVVKCRRDNKNGLVCVASANVQKNTENATKVYVGDAWTKTKLHAVKTKDKGIEKVNSSKIKGNRNHKSKHKKKKGGTVDKSSGESMSGSIEEHVDEGLPPASEENSTPHGDQGDFSSSITTANYGAHSSDEVMPEAQVGSQEQAGADYSGDQESRVGRKDAPDMDVEGDGEAARPDLQRQGYHMNNNQWTPINPARLEQDDSGQDQAGEKRDTSSGNDVTVDYHVTPPPLKSTTTVLGVNRDYKPLQAIFGRQVQTTPTPSQVSNVKYGDMYWSMVRGKVAGANEDPRSVSHVQTSTPGEAVKLSNGLNIDDHLRLVNGWGSHIDGTEDALRRPEAFPANRKPADISSEVHLTTTSPDGIALYYQNEAEEEANTQKHGVKQDEEETEENSAENEHVKEESHVSTTIPSVTTVRFRGRVKFGDQIKSTAQPDEDAEAEANKSLPADLEAIVEGAAEEAAEEAAEDVTEESQEDEGEADGTDKPDSLLDEVRKDLESAKDELQSALESRAKNSGPNLVTETGHVLSGFAVAEQLEAQQW